MMSQIREIHCLRQQKVAKQEMYARRAALATKRLLASFSKGR